MRNLTLGIRAQLMAGIVITTVAGIGLIGVLSIKIIENRSVYSKAVEAARTARLIRGVYITAESQGNPSRLSSFIGAATREAGVRKYRLMGPGGAVIAKGGVMPDESGTVMSEDDGVTVRRIGGGWFSGPGEALHVRAYMGLSRSGAVLNFLLPLTDIENDMAGVRRFLFIYAIFESVVIVAFGVFFLSRSITRPIRRLEEAATRISGGSLGERAEVDMDNEIGSLARSFNTMAERLEGEIKSLERVNLELMQAQDEVLRSNTLAAVGRLAAGVAHEIGNPLGAVQGYLDILSRDAPLGTEEKEILARTVKETGRIDAMLREFLDLSRPSRRPAAPVDVNRVIMDSIAAAEAQTGFSGGVGVVGWVGGTGGVRVKSTLCEDLPPVSFDEGKLRQVFVNLILNAVHAVEDAAGEGTVTVESSVEKHSVPPPRKPMRRGDDRPFLREAETPVEREFVSVRFTDTGKGITEEDGKKIFEPFFTTKEAGKGTGLGLFVSESIVKTCGGEIGFVSRPGEGSTFTVLLPAGSKGS